MGWKWDSASLSHNIWKELSHSDKPWKGKPAATGLESQTSSGNMCVPIVYGRAKVGPNLIWNGDFQAKRHKQGKGGGGQGTGEYDYSASLILGLCEGPITGISNVWRDLYSKISETEYQNLYGAVEFLGTYAQTPWSFITTNHPTEALAYRGVAYLGLPNYSLGTKPAIPSHSVEVKGILFGTGVGNTVDDADPALMIQDFLTNTHYGTSFNSACIDLDSLLSSGSAPTTGDSAYQTYCRAMGFALSPALSDSDSASKWLKAWLNYTNSAAVWSGNKLKFIPYGTETVTANGVTFLPINTIRYNLVLGDLIAGEGEDPITFERNDPQDAKNAVVIEVLDRTADYVATPVGARDQANIESYGLKQAETEQAHDIKILQMGKTLANLQLLRENYIRNIYSFTTTGSFILLEAMDIVTLTEPLLGMSQYPVRITQIEEQEDGTLQIEAEDFPEGIGATTQYTTQVMAPTITNQAAAPGDVQNYLVYEPPASLVAGAPQVWIAATSAAADWGGCNVWVSTDGGTNYYQVGTISHDVRMGVLTATLATFVPPNPDSAHTLSVSLVQSKGELDSGSASDAANGLTLCYVDGELISYQTSALTGTNAYNLTTLYRGLYGSTIGAHLSTTRFVRLDDAVFKYALPSNQIGIALKIKLQSFNTFGNSAQDLSTLTPINFTPSGTAYAIDAPTGFVATGIGGASALSWTASTSTIISGYKIYALNNHSGSFGSATLVGTVGVGTTSFNHVGLTPGSLWRYWVVAYNAVNASTPAGPQDTTTGASGGATAFTGLSDVPGSYAGASLKAVRVNVGETALEFYTPSSGSFLSPYYSTLPTVPTYPGSFTLSGTGAIASQTTRGILLGNTTTTGGNTLLTVVKPSTNWTLTTFDIANFAGNRTSNKRTLAITDGTKVEEFGFVMQGVATQPTGTLPTFRRIQWTNVNTYSSDTALTNIQQGYPDNNTPMWQRLAYNGTNFVYSISVDGENWNVIYSGAPSFIAAASVTAVGYMMASGAVVPAIATDNVHIFSFTAV